MNRSDIYLVVTLIIILLIIFIGTNIYGRSANNYAYVYYNDNVIKKIDLSIKGTKEYEVKGFNGSVILETKNNSIRVKSENSPLHLCSNMNYINSTFETIVCLPNKIVIKIVNQNKQIDTVVR